MILSSWRGGKCRKINPARQHTAELTSQGAALCQSSADTRKSPRTNTQRAAYLQDQGCQLEDRLTFDFDLPLCRERAEGERWEPSCPYRAQRSAGPAWLPAQLGGSPTLSQPSTRHSRLGSVSPPFVSTLCVHRHTQSVSTSPRLLSHPLFS